MRIAVVAMLLAACRTAPEVPPTPPPAALGSVEVPEGVRYTTAASSTLEPVAAKLRAALAPDATEALFGEVAQLGPFLWKRAPEPVGGIPVLFEIPGHGRLEGRALREASELRALEAKLRAALAADGGFEIRRPNTRELGVYWAMVSYDLVDPILVVESATHAYFFDFQGGAFALAVDDLKGASL